MKFINYWAAIYLLLTTISQAQKPTKSISVPDSMLIKVYKFDLGDELVITKYNQTNDVDFKLVTKDPAKPPKLGVSKPMLAAMHKRDTAPPMKVPPAPTASHNPGSGEATTTSSVVGP